MHRFCIYLASVLLCFCAGLASWYITSIETAQSYSDHPLQLSIISANKYQETFTMKDRNFLIDKCEVKVKVQNKSQKSVVAYALRYGEEKNKTTLPRPKQQALAPGESLTDTIEISGGCTLPKQVDTDFVYFSDGSTWGPNQIFARDFIRE